MSRTAICIFSWALIFSTNIAHAVTYDANTVGIDISSKVAGPLEDMKLYSIDFKCTQKRPLRDPLGQSSTFSSKFITTSEVVYIGSQSTTIGADGSAQLPSSAPIVVPVFSVDEGKGNRFDATTCNESFYVAGGQTLHLVAAINYNETYKASAFSRVIWAGLSLVSPFYSLLVSKPLPTEVSDKIANVQAMQDPLDKVFAALNHGDSYAKQVNLDVGTYKIETYYVRLTITVRPIESLVLDKTHTSFRSSYRKQIAQAQPLTAKDFAASPGICLKIAGAMQDLGFSSGVDLAYATYIIAIKSDLSQEQIIKCLGRKYAYTAVAHKNVFFNSGDRDEHVFTEPIIVGVLGTDNGFGPRPNFDAVAGTTDTLIKAMAQYTRNKSENVPPNAYVVLRKYLAENVTVLDDTAMGVLKMDSTPSSQLEMLNKFKDSGYIRFGCMWQAVDELEPYLDNIPLAFLAFNAKNEDTRVAFDKGLVLRPIFSNGKIVQLGVSQNIEWEKFLLTKRNFACIDLYVDKPPDMAKETPAKPENPGGQAQP